jgi:hypothetical protein
MMTKMDLSEEEVKIISQLRKKKAQEEAEKKRFLRLLETAFEFAKWMQENGVGASYSTFCDEFEYVDFTLLEHRTETYKHVMALINTARNFVRGNDDD